MAVSGFTFYGDESGSHHDPAGSFVLSGYLATDDVWAEFEGRWQDVLEHGRKIEWFHMRECIKLEAQFQSFNRYQADKKLNDLIDVLIPFLKSRRIIEFTAVLDWPVYDRAVSGPVKATFHDPYLFLIGALEAEVVKCVSMTPNPAPVWFFFDDQTCLMENHAGTQFYRARATIPSDLLPLLHGLSFASDKIMYPLQAADLIAWQRHRKEINLAEDLGERKDFKRLHNASNGTIHRFREDGLLSFCERMERGLPERGIIE